MTTLGSGPGFREKPLSNTSFAVHAVVDTRMLDRGLAKHAVVGTSVGGSLNAGVRTGVILGVIGVVSLTGQPGRSDMTDEIRIIRWFEPQPNKNLLAKLDAGDFQKAIEKCGYESAHQQGRKGQR